MTRCQVPPAQAVRTQDGFALEQAGPCCGDINAVNRSSAQPLRLLPPSAEVK